MSHAKSDLQHPIGYDKGEQHVGKPKVDKQEEQTLPPQAGTHGQPDSHISGQTGPEIMGGSASTRVTGQSVDEQLKKPLV